MEKLPLKLLCDKMSGLERNSNPTSYCMTREIKVQVVNNLARVEKKY